MSLPLGVASQAEPEQDRGGEAGPVEHVGDQRSSGPPMLDPNGQDGGDERRGASSEERRDAAAEIAPA
jgi:hypothetical protein